MMHLLGSPWAFVFVAPLLVFVDAVVMRRPRRRMVAVTATAVMALSATACEHPKIDKQQAQTPAPAVPDTVNIALYNRGTKLLTHDSLQAAMLRLDSAMESKDSTVGFRTAFNSGWNYLLNGTRLQRYINKGGQNGDSLLKVLQKDTAFINAELADLAEADDSSESDKSDNSDMDGAGKGAHLKTVASLSDDDKNAVINDYMSEQLDSALSRYHTALLANPKDDDAKWNYELALVASNSGQPREGEPRDSKGKGRKGRRSKSKGKKGKAPTKGKGNPSKTKGSPAQAGKPKGKPAPDKDKNGKGQANLLPKKGPSKGSMGPPPMSLRLPPQQAEQLLNAMGQHEQQAVKSVPVLVTPPPQGKDW